MTGRYTKTRWGQQKWVPDFHTQEVIDTSRTLQALIDAMAVKCPECSRIMGNACVLPEGLESLGVFVHHQRIAAGARAVSTA